MTNYSSEQLEKLLNNLPQGLQEVILNNETNDLIYKVLENNQVLDKRAGQISDLIRNVLFGLLPPTEFVPALEKEAGLDNGLAKKIGQEINRFVFFPVKESLAQLYQTGSSPSPKTKENPTISKAQPGGEIPEPPAAPDKSDTYREAIE